MTNGSDTAAGNALHEGAERLKPQRPYWNPYVAGVCLGLTLLFSFLVLGRGFGVSGGFTSLLAFLVDLIPGDHASSNGMFGSYLEGGGSPLLDPMAIVIFGIFAGGFLSALTAGRIQRAIIRGPRSSPEARMALAFAGGVLMGFAAKIARGCTSGQALTGGSLMSPGSWIFMLSMFAAAFIFARIVRSQWS